MCVMDPQQHSDHSSVSHPAPHRLESLSGGEHACIHLLLPLLLLQLCPLYTLQLALNTWRHRGHDSQLSTHLIILDDFRLNSYWMLFIIPQCTKFKITPTSWTHHCTDPTVTPMYRSNSHTTVQIQQSHHCTDLTVTPLYRSNSHTTVQIQQSHHCTDPTVTPLYRSNSHTTVQIQQSHRCTDPTVTPLYRSNSHTTVQIQQSHHCTDPTVTIAQLLLLFTNKLKF